MKSIAPPPPFYGYAFYSPVSCAENLDVPPSVNFGPGPSDVCVWWGTGVNFDFPLEEDGGQPSGSWIAYCGASPPVMEFYSSLDCSGTPIYSGPFGCEDNLEGSGSVTVLSCQSPK